MKRNYTWVLFAFFFKISLYAQSIGTVINIKFTPSILSTEKTDQALNYLNSPQFFINSNATIRFTIAKKWILGVGINYQRRKGDNDEVYVPSPNNLNSPTLFLTTASPIIYSEYITHTVKNRENILDIPFTFGYVLYCKKKKNYKIYTLLNISPLQYCANKSNFTSVTEAESFVIKQEKISLLKWREMPFNFALGLSLPINKAWTLLAEPTFYSDDYRFKTTAIGLGIGVNWTL